MCCLQKEESATPPKHDLHSSPGHLVQTANMLLDSGLWEIHDVCCL